MFLYSEYLSLVSKLLLSINDAHQFLTTEFEVHFDWISRFVVKLLSLVVLVEELVK